MLFRSEHPNSLHVFIHADMEERKKRAVEEYHYDAKDAERTLLRRDKARANHYRYYTECEWGKSQNYDVTLDSSTLGIDGCVEIIKSIALK